MRCPYASTEMFLTGVPGACARAMWSQGGMPWLLCTVFDVRSNHRGCRAVVSRSSDQGIRPEQLELHDTAVRAQIQLASAALLSTSLQASANSFHLGPSVVPEGCLKAGKDSQEKVESIVRDMGPERAW